MSGRVFVAPQAGRLDRSRREDDEPWGTTASQSHFRAYEPTEAKNCRGATAAPFEPARPARTTRTPSASLTSHELRAVPEGGMLTAEPSVVGGSSVTRLSAGTARTGATPSAASGRGQRAEQWSRVRGPTRLSAYQEDQRLAQEARMQHFPYRDEFAPRSKRLLYELAHARCSRDAGSTASGAASVSCFTVASTAAGASTAGGSSVARSASEASLPRLHTGDSQRVNCSLARRRKELDLRAPNQWAPDSAWLHERLKEEGPAGITTANHVGRMYNATLRREGERINSVTGIFSGEKD